MNKTINTFQAALQAIAPGRRFKLLILSLLLLCAPAKTFAQNVGPTASGNESFIFYLVISLVFFVMILVLVVAIYTLSILKMIIKSERGQTEEEVETETWWDKLKLKMTDAVPVEQEETVLLTHEYDGIKELDNHLPPWWKWLFYATIIFAVFYLAVHHVWKTAPLQIQEYQNELLAAAQLEEERGGDDEDAINEDNVTFSNEVAVIEKGKQLYDVNCVACHRNDAGGLPGLGPNLTDEYWLHGGGIKNIFKTIQNGVQGTSMISWKTQMSPEDMRSVASYVMTVEGTNPPNAREPQGERYVPEAEAAPKEATPESDSLPAE